MSSINICCVIIFLMCLSMQHRCSARLIGSGRQKALFFVEQTKKHIDEMGLVVEGRKGDKININGNKMQFGSTIISTISEDAKHLQSRRRSVSESKIFGSLNHVSLIKRTYMKELPRRWMLVKEAKGQEYGDHVAVTDYEPPHQTPPIHNRIN